MFTRLKFLKEKFNFNPKVIYDIGAYEGNWTSEAKKIFPDAKYYLFEANDDKKEILEELKCPTYYDVLYSKDNQSVDYHKCLLECQTGNSIFKENTKYFDDLYSEKESRLTQTLTSIVEKDHLPIPNLLKIDTQGSELDILKGFEKYYNLVEVILLELSLHKYNANAPLINEVTTYLATKKYVLFDIVDLHYSSNVLIQIDALFCHIDSKFILKRL